jgi:uncharacterized protein YciI
VKAIPLAALAALMMLAGGALAEDEPGAVSPSFDEALANSVGADDYGMRQYVLVILKTGPTPMPAGAARDEMFRGHFANMKRLAAEGKLALAGPLDGVDGWRGLFILAVSDLEEAAALVATDPVVIHGEMVAEYHKYYGSAALMLVNETHEKVARKGF